MTAVLVYFVAVVLRLLAPVCAVVALLVAVGAIGSLFGAGVLVWALSAAVAYLSSEVVA